MTTKTALVSDYKCIGNALLTPLKHFIMLIVIVEKLLIIANQVLLIVNQVAK